MVDVDAGVGFRMIVKSKKLAKYGGLIGRHQKAVFKQAISERYIFIVIRKLLTVSQRVEFGVALTVNLIYCN
jgi:hypothetical protein